MLGSKLQTYLLFLHVQGATHIALQLFLCRTVLLQATVRDPPLVVKTTEHMLPGFNSNVLLNNPLLFCVQIGLVPGLSVGMGDGGTGCFAASDGVTRVSFWHYRTQCLCMHLSKSFEIRCQVVNKSCLSDNMLISHILGVKHIMGSLLPCHGVCVVITCP